MESDKIELKSPSSRSFLRNILLVAGEPSGDALGAELLQALWESLDSGPNSWRPRVFGAGGSNLASAGMELLADMTKRSAVGLTDVVRQYAYYRGIFDQLLKAASDQLPEIIILVDFSGFNRRFASAIRKLTRNSSGPFKNWKPLIVYFVSPQVWASRSGRAASLESDIDLLLSIIPFEKEWYASRFPRLNVEFIGHPILDRYEFPIGRENALCQRSHEESSSTLVSQAKPWIGLLLPGSRTRELERHLPPMLEALQLLETNKAVRIEWKLILPNQHLCSIVEKYVLNSKCAERIQISFGDLKQWLPKADIAVASTGTVTMELACFEIPTVAIYKTSFLTYQIGKRIIEVPFLAMPNLLAGQSIIPELIQEEATGLAIAREIEKFVTKPEIVCQTREALHQVRTNLGTPGACRRGAELILQLKPRV